MNAPNHSRQALRFAVFEVDFETRELRKRGSRVRLPHQAFHVLQLLLENRGRVVTREELQRALWPADTHVEFDRGLNNAISRLRDILDDSSLKPRFIETIPRVGYTFIAPVVAPDTATNLPAASPETASPETTSPQTTSPVMSLEAKPDSAAKPPPRQPRLLTFLFAGALIVALGLLTWQVFGRRREAAAPRSLAVLPLKYVGPNAQADDYLADGITGALITELSKLHRVRVISETSSRQFARTTRSLPEVAHELGVEAIVEGSVQRDGNAVRVTVQLVRSDDTHVWAETYTRGLGSVLVLQSDVALAIAQAIGEQFSPVQRRQMTTVQAIDPEAYRLYVAGDGLRRKGLERDLYMAIDDFQRALAIAPDYAEVHVALAESWIALAGWMGAVLPRDGFPKARAAAERALKIEPDLAEARLAVAHITDVFDWDLKAAERMYQRVVEISPNNALAWTRYGEHLNRTGRLKEGVEKTQRAYQLDPLAVDTLIGAGGHLVDSGKPEEGLALLRKAIELEPDNFEPWSHIAENYSRAHRINEAIEAGKRGVELSNHSAHAMQMLATIYANNGRPADALDLLHTLEMPGSSRNPYILGVIHLKLGDKEQALRWLTVSCKEHTMQLAFAEFQSRAPMFDPIRKDPRFERVVHCGDRP